MKTNTSLTRMAIAGTLALHTAAYPAHTSADCILQLGPGGSGFQDMEHIGIAFDGTTITLTKQGAVPEPVVLDDYGQICAPPVDVLNGKGYNGQYGWLISGFWAPPSGGHVWIKRIDQTTGLETYDANTFAPLFGTAGSSNLWEWDGTMTHNWYVASSYGLYEATYEVYIGDATGFALPGLFSDQITLTWEYLLVKADLDYDGDVDPNDFLTFSNCFNGALNPPTPTCTNGHADLDGDGDVDPNDFLTFSNCFNGALNPPAPGCP